MGTYITLCRSFLFNLNATFIVVLNTRFQSIIKNVNMSQRKQLFNEEKCKSKQQLIK